ncbi:MAG: undecaprenyl-phosphate glucose phosphotransferase [Pirellulales bacterium]
MSRQIHEHWSTHQIAYRLIDTLAIGLAWYWVAAAAQVPLDSDHLLAMLAAILCFFFSGEVTGLYRNWRGAAADREILCVWLTWFLAWPLLICLGFLNRHVASQLHVYVWPWLACGLITLATLRAVARLTLRTLRLRGLNTRKYAVVGINELAFELVSKIEQSTEMGLEFCGLYDDRSPDRRPPVPADLTSHIGPLDTLVQDAREGRVHIVYITFPMRAEDRIKDVLAEFADSTASVYIVPDFFVFELLHSRWTNIGGIPAVSIFENPFYGVDGFVKRMLDIVLSATAIVLLSIPMLILAVLVKLSSPGPIFFRQRRYGLDGRQIWVWKFRSMRVCEDGASVVQATRHDTRTTPIGAFLRRTSLDELPQLFNVLEGTMSLVGPRPHANAHNEAYRQLIQGYMLRHKVKPGITGLAQVNGWRGETDTLEKMQKRVEFDHRYIREWSLLLDLKILFRTLTVVFHDQNAY